MRKLTIEIPNEYCNEDDNGDGCLLLGHTKHGYYCRYFHLYLKEEKSEDGITFNILPCEDCLKERIK